MIGALKIILLYFFDVSHTTAMIPGTYDNYFQV
jgi:hypothetical protein